MQKKILFWALISLPLFLSAQKQYTISGYIEDAQSGEKLISANVFDSHSGAGAVTNTYGFYSLTLPSDSVDLSVSYIGYQNHNQTLYLDANHSLNFKLSSFAELKTVVVTADHAERIEQKTQMGQMEIPIDQIKRLPALLGEVDVLKALQLLPGVQSGGEGQNGLYVRGGSPDQNLILLDGVPIYNVSHLLGLFSVFNADAIKNVTLTKGGFPARYGGRLSSVLEINMNEGNLNEFHGEGSIGLISSKLTLQGPILKGKTSFLISARRTYADLIFKPIIKASTPADEKIDINLYFYDLNAKIQHKINDKHRIFLSAYSGADVFGSKFKDQFGVYEGGIDWGNIISAARWNWQIGSKMFANTTLTYSRYNIDINAGSENFDATGNSEDKFSVLYTSGIEDFGGKIDLDYIPNPNHYIRFGAGWTNHTYRPGALSLKIEDGQDFNLDTLVGSQNNYSNEFSLYIEDDFKLGDLKINAGVHLSGFAVDNEFYTSVQPRLGLRYLLNNGIALKAGFSTMTQYINLLTSEALTLPTDLWVPSTARVKPQQSWQVALGAAKTINSKYELSIEAYYKEMDNVISFKEGASFLFGLENDWEDKVTQGTGESYGLEVFFQKKRGKTTGWIGYTLSWNNRQFDEIFGGEKFPYRYDRRHDVSVVVNHDFNEKIGLSAAWVYGTGNAITLNTFSYPNYVSNNFGNEPYYGGIESGGQKNAFRMTNYHRLDMSVEFKKKKKRYERKWVVGVYNAYYHRNPYFVISDTQNTYNNQGELIKSENVFKEISILPIIPSVSYQFKF